MLHSNIYKDYNKIKYLICQELQFESCGSCKRYSNDKSKYRYCITYNEFLFQIETIWHYQGKDGIKFLVKNSTPLGRKCLPIVINLIVPELLDWYEKVSLLI